VVRILSKAIMVMQPITVHRVMATTERIPLLMSRGNSHGGERE
jgi:hypothetical protein